jgi:hypothetical protein
MGISDLKRIANGEKKPSAEIIDLDAHRKIRGLPPAKIHEVIYLDEPEIRP